ncbi:hypothetical protein [Endozoicomonas sp.]|uniref:hypothetical protein n=1 Tax=Endozoicomonas sp. TaxID=1892382 RepID=UPI002885BB08|nr:hypothetical protein [Endozoicomonas sp.]
MIDLDLEAPTKKAKCKELMFEIFGPKCAERVDAMSESECIEKCKEKVQSLLGNVAAKRFDCLK